MQRQKTTFESNVERFSDVAAALRRQHRLIFRKSFTRYFDGKRSAARSVVDELFEAGKNETKRQQILQEFMPEQQVQQKLDEARAEIRSHVEKEIADFFRSFQRQLQAIAIDFQKAKVGQMAGVDMADASRIGETANLLRELGVASGVVSGLVFTVVAMPFLGPVGTILGIGTANIWNPVGWGLVAVGVGLGIFGHFKSKEMKEKLEKAKTEAASKLRQTVDQTERSINEGLETWVEATITKIRKEHIDVMAQYAQYAGKHLNEVAALTEFLDMLVTKVQKAKYQSMIRRFESDETVIVEDVVEGNDGVSITLSENVKHLRRLEMSLSRVEERTVVIGRSACRS